MTMFLANVFSICFLIGMLSAAPTPPTPPTPPSTSSSAAVSSLPNNILGQLRALHDDLKKACNETTHGICRNTEIQNVNFSFNCTQVFYKNMFCQAYNVLHQNKCSIEVSKKIPTSLRGNQTNCGPSGSQDTGTTLHNFCYNLTATVGRMYNRCYIKGSATEF